MIIDINKQEALNYGINWNWGAASAGGAGINMVLPGGIGNKLLARIHANDARDQSETMSLPSIVTLNNTEAVFSSTANRYITVSGFQDASLNKVTTETALRITPLIANESNSVAYDERRVKLLINVQDGAFDAFDAANPNAAPATTQSQITTQAVVRSGDSLVIGGQVIRKKNTNRSGFPGLSSIPGIGYLFSQTEDTTTDWIRIYVVRPQILGEDSRSAAIANPAIAGQTTKPEQFFAPK
jgi:type III secretion protein C